MLFYLRNCHLTKSPRLLKVPVGTVKSRLFRARRLLRQAMTARGVRSLPITDGRPSLLVDDVRRVTASELSLRCADGATWDCCWWRRR